MGDKQGHPFRGNQWTNTHSGTRTNATISRGDYKSANPRARLDEMNESLDVETQRIRDTMPGSSRLEAFVASGGDLYLDTIKIPKEHQGEGHGTRAMEAVISWADERGLSMSLNPEADPGKKEALRRFYRSLGFGPKSSRRFYDATARGAWVRPARKKTK